VTDNLEELMSLRAEEIAIRAEPTQDALVCRFVVDRPLVPGAAVRCASPEQAAGSPLLERLFALAGVREVYAYGSCLMIARDEGSDEWPVLGRRIGAAIRQTLLAGEPAVSEAATLKTPAEADLRARVQKLFDEQINPALEGHGGFVEIADVRGSELYLVMGGGCQGCASAQMTLRQGVERALRDHVPEVTAIYDVTDHAAGRNPYYS
jgi:Fe-S cluster biogenesis protein NfuA